MPRYVGSKWRKTRALLYDKRLRRLVPKTVRFNRTALYRMLQEFRMVYLKPDSGTHGKGVMRVEYNQGQYRLQYGLHSRSYASFDQMLQAIRKQVSRRSYLIQRGIRLLTHHGRKFDLRIMTQLSPRKSWKTTGIIGRLAAPGKIVTNYHSGGTPLPAALLLSSHLSKSAIARKVSELGRLGVTTAAAMRRMFPGVSEIGLDVGMDSSFTPWFIEVNTCPDPYIFRRLPDQSVFRRIIRYARANGRLRHAPRKARIIKRRIR